MKVEVHIMDQWW